MKRTAYILATIGSVAASTYSFFYFAINPTYDDQHPWLAIGLLVGFVLLASWFFYLACSDNIHNIKQGHVIGHGFTPAHMSAAIHTPGSTVNGIHIPGVYIPSRPVPDDWALHIKDKQGRQGWIHFDGDIRKRYPIGSYYKGK